MKKVWYPLRKEYPELRLKIEYDDRGFTFTGNKTPAHLLNKNIITYDNLHKRRIYIQSASYPAIYDDPLQFTFYIGGADNNPNTFLVSCHNPTPNRLKQNLDILDTYFKKEIILNKQITIL